ncbi:PKD domain containing protein [Cellulophaga algicola DSM 14237]|uniref:PKD domain containing protein n=1 Tax=Cellulophaga algicola (strain DSM 14237 / IC166 / ACAM 630) TaxID=688270 RepID=E6XAP9_CELAD|nr:PKD domain-containing protein [Cellulophaga algicola]ADV51011.1 PKD domain containing protein [Cellulophaga algicola DSM 14237]
MKNFKTLGISLILILTIIIACTKEVGLYTEVEFEITEEHEVDGFINNPLATFLIVTPEELLEDLSYSFSYKINSGAGYFEAVDGTIIQEGEKASFNPLSASLDYIPTSIGDHSVTFTASDTFGFTEEITLTYTITNIPVTWTAEGPTGPVLLGSSQSITLTLGNEAAITGATYQRNYSFSEGSGNLYTAAPESNTIAVNDFVSIVPGTYQLEYISNELGITTIEFLLRDSNEQELIATVTFEVVDELSTEKEITSFIVNGIAGTITGTTIDVVLPEGTDLTALAPVIIHTGASISPESEINQDFSNPVIYTVTAQDETIQAYTVNVTVPSANQAPTAIATSDVTSGVPSLDVQFTGDTSTDPDAGDVLTYAWNFGDGSTATTANPSHTFTTAGTYTVTLTVTDDRTPALNSTDTITIIVTDANQAPTAIATSDVTSGEVSLDVQFTGDTSTDPDTGDTLTYAWNFGDGTTATTANPSHTFTTAGTYTVTLTVTDDGTPALSSSEVTITITVNAPANQTPTAIATSDVTSGVPSLDVQFTGDTSSDPDTGDTLTYAWNFGDGTTATTANPSHTFTTVGTYTVTLTVTDNGTPALSSSEVTITITVNAPANQAPTAVADNYSVIKGTNNNLFNVIANDSDPDGDTLTVTLELFPLNGTATMSGNQVSYSPNINFVGTDQIGYQISDGNGGMASGSITVTVTGPTNQAPTAVATGPTATITGVVENFYADSSSDPDGDNLTYLWDFGDTTTSNLINPTHSYTTVGTYTVTLTVTDNGSPVLSDSEVILINVTGATPTATFSNSQIVTDANPSTQGILTINNGNISFTINIFGGTGSGGVSLIFTILGVDTWNVYADQGDVNNSITDLIPPGTYNYYIDIFTVAGGSDSSGSVIAN